MTSYLDNSATTKPCREAVEAVFHMMAENFGNPSSLHQAGNLAYQALEQAREEVAHAVGCEKEALYFTSGGTEANNLALFGSALANRRRGRRIVTSAIEHESVLESAKELEKMGFEVVCLTPDSGGRITEEQVLEAVNEQTILVSLMLVNNEVGTVLPVQAARKAVRRCKAPAVIHCDAVQAFGKMPVKPAQLGVDLLTVTGHKIHGPKGVGALYIKKGTPMIPRTYGGEQEGRKRPGTEPIPLIAGFGAAAKALPDWREQEALAQEWNRKCRDGLKKLGGVVLNSPPEASPYILNLSPLGVKSQTMIQHLSSRYQVYVSNGSACAKGKKSHVLTAMGLSPERIDSAIRVSFSRDNNARQIDRFLEGLEDGLAHLARAK